MSGTFYGPMLIKFGISQQKGTIMAKSLRELNISGIYDLPQVSSEKKQSSTSRKSLSQSKDIHQKKIKEISERISETVLFFSPKNTTAQDEQAIAKLRNLIFKLLPEEFWILQGSEVSVSVKRFIYKETLKIYNKNQKILNGSLSEYLTPKKTLIMVNPVNCVASYITSKDYDKRFSIFEKAVMVLCTFMDNYAFLDECFRNIKKKSLNSELIVYFSHLTHCLKNLELFENACREGNGSKSFDLSIFIDKSIDDTCLFLVSRLEEKFLKKTNNDFQLKDFYDCLYDEIHKLRLSFSSLLAGNQLSRHSHKLKLTWPNAWCLSLILAEILEFSSRRYKTISRENKPIKQLILGIQSYILQYREFLSIKSPVDFATISNNIFPLETILSCLIQYLFDLRKKEPQFDADPENQMLLAQFISYFRQFLVSVNIPNKALFIAVIEIKISKLNSTRKDMQIVECSHPHEKCPREMPVSSVSFLLKVLKDIDKADFNIGSRQKSILEVRRSLEGSERLLIDFLLLHGDQFRCDVLQRIKSGDKELADIFQKNELLKKIYVICYPDRWRNSSAHEILTTLQSWIEKVKKGEDGNEGEIAEVKQKELLVEQNDLYQKAIELMAGHCNSADGHLMKIDQTVDKCHGELLAHQDNLSQLTDMVATQEKYLQQLSEQVKLLAECHLEESLDQIQSGLTC